MMEMLKEIIESFICFDLVEGILYCYFLTTIFKLNKVKFKNIVLMSFVNSIICIVFNILGFQILMAVNMLFFIKKTNRLVKNKEIIIDIVLLMFSKLIIQVIIVLVVEKFYQINILNDNTINTILFYISIVFEIIFTKNINKIGVYQMIKTWFLGCGVQR